MHGIFFVTAIGSFAGQSGSRRCGRPSKTQKHKKKISFWYTRFMVGWVWVLFVYPMPRCGIIRYNAWQTKGPGNDTESTNTLNWKFQRNWSVPFGFRPHPTKHNYLLVNPSLGHPGPSSRSQLMCPVSVHVRHTQTRKDGRIPILRRVMVGAVIQAERSLGSPRSIDTQSRRCSNRIGRHVFFLRPDLVNFVSPCVNKKETKQK